MAPVGTLWGMLRQPWTKIILSVAALNDLELEQPEWSFTDKPAAFTSKFAYGKIPAFEGTDGFTLTESIPIARYLSGLGTKVNLLGSSAKEVALVDQWIHFAEQEVGAPSYSIMGMIYGFAGPFNREALDKLKSEKLVRALTYLESYLETRPSGYLVTDSVTLADIVLVGMVYMGSVAALGAADRAKYPKVYEHYARVTEVEVLKQYWEMVSFTEEAVTEPKPVPQ